MPFLCTGLYITLGIYRHGGARIVRAGERTCSCLIDIGRPWKAEVLLLAAAGIRKAEILLYVPDPFCIIGSQELILLSKYYIRRT